MPVMMISFNKNTSEIPAGYKKTEVGLIPKDWGVELLGDIFNFSGGFTASREQLSSKGHCYLHYGDIHKSNQSFIDVRAEYLDIPKLNIPLKRVSSKSLLADGDVVFVDASEDDDGTSRHVVIINKAEIPYISGLHTIVAKSKKSSLDNAYKRFCFQTHNIKRQFYYYAVGTKVSGISKTNIAKIFIPVPPTLDEQYAIATVLGDTDALIDSLEKLIVKKRDLKQAAMQQLLTGKKRLPGFSEEWEVKQLGSLGEFRGGSGFPTKHQGDIEGDFPFFKVSDMNNEGNSTFMINCNNWISENTREQIGASTFPANTIVFAKIGAAIFLERKKILSQESCIDNNMMGFVLHEKMTHHKFVHYLFLTIQLGKLIAATALPSLNSKEIAALEYAIPKPAEQIAIAAVLTDIDYEIAMLEQRLAKTRDLKQGMMQELLTGRIRLV